MQTIKFFNNTSIFASPEIDKIAAHSVSKGAMEGIRGGHFEHAFFTDMASAAGGAALNGGMCDRLTAAERSCLASFPIQSIEKRNNTWQINNIN